MSFTKVTKKMARRLVDTDKDVYVCPCNMHPANIWQPALLMPTCTQLLDHDLSLTQWLINYQYYNCDKERGKSLRFYTKDK